MTDNIKLPPYPEGLCLREDIEDYAREAVRLNATVPEGLCLREDIEDYAREAVRLNATVPDGYALVSVDAMKRWRDAFAEELSAWDIDPPLHHVQTSHDEIEAMLSAAPAAPQPAQQGDAANALIKQALKSAEELDNVLPQYDEDAIFIERASAVLRLIAAQAQEAAPAAQAELSDPLQGAANWLLEAIGGCNIRTLEWHLMIDFNRAERLMLAARAAQQKGASNG